MFNKITINIINAFTDAGEGGNPAGVVYPADEFSNEVKQKIAAKPSRLRGLRRLLKVWSAFLLFVCDSGTSMFLAQYEAGVWTGRPGSATRPQSLLPGQDNRRT